MMHAAIVCKWMGGWEYETYERQPIAFLDAIVSLIHQEARALRKASP